MRSGGHSIQFKALRAGELAYAKLVCLVRKRKKKSHQSIRFHPRPLVPCSFACGRKTHVCIKNSRCMSVDSILVLSIVSFVGENTHVCIKNSRCIRRLVCGENLWSGRKTPVVVSVVPIVDCMLFHCSDCVLYIPIAHCPVHSDVVHYCTISKNFSSSSNTLCNSLLSSLLPVFISICLAISPCMKV